mgnify:FL=1|jgi:hypothetical protein
MQIFVRSLEETFPVTLPASATLNDLKNAIEDKEFLPASVQRVSFNGLTLVNGSLVGCLEEADTVVLEVGLDGGMRAKWRKKRMRRLRRKRRKMRQRAR